jgi:hypothetical protein
VDHDLALSFEREIYGRSANSCEFPSHRFHRDQMPDDCDRYREYRMRISMTVTSSSRQGRQARLEDEFCRLIDSDGLQIRKLFWPGKDGAPTKQLLLIPPTLSEHWTV